MFRCSWKFCQVLWSHDHGWWTLQSDYNICLKVTWLFGEASPVTWPASPVTWLASPKDQVTGEAGEAHHMTGEAGEAITWITWLPSPKASPKSHVTSDIFTQILTVNEKRQCFCTENAKQRVKASPWESFTSPNRPNRLGNYLRLLKSSSCFHLSKSGFVSLQECNVVLLNHHSEVLIL